MPKALLTQTFDNFSGKVKNFQYAHLKQYDLGKGVKVQLKKEKKGITCEAGWGLKAVTSIPKDFVLGCFVVKARDAEKPEEGTYNIRTRRGKYIVMEQLSLMNRVNTIAQKRYRGRCNCVIGNVKKGQVSIRTIKPVRAGAMLWTKYGEKKHYWEIQYYILQKRLRAVPPLDANEDKCRDCHKRHLELMLCDTCSEAICEKCLTQKENFLRGREYFFCQKCLEDPPKYMNRYKRK